MHVQWEFHKCGAFQYTATLRLQAYEINCIIEKGWLVYPVQYVRSMYLNTHWVSIVHIIDE